MNNYNGYGDWMLEQGNARSIPQQNESGKRTKIEITNTSTSANDTPTLILFPSNYTRGEALARVIKTGNVEFAAGKTCINVSASQQPIEVTHQHMKDNSIVITGIVFTTKNLEQFGYDLIIKTVNPFGTDTERVLPLNKLVNESNQNEKVIRFKEPILKTKYQEISLRIAAATGTSPNVVNQVLTLEVGFGASCESDTYLANAIAASR